MPLFTFFCLLLSTLTPILTFSDNAMFLVKTGAGANDYATTTDIVVTAI